MIAQPDMRSFRKLIGALFGVIAIFCLLAAAGELRYAILGSQGHSHHFAFIATAFMLGVCSVFSAAAWTTLRERPQARAWGLAASVLWLAAPLFNSYMEHRPLSRARWELLAVGTIALIAFAWPDAEQGPFHANYEGEDVIEDHPHD